MILFNTDKVYFAFNWNPKVKPNGFIDHSINEEFFMVDFWKFRVVTFTK